MICYQVTMCICALTRRTHSWLVLIGYGRIKSRERGLSPPPSPSHHLAPPRYLQLVTPRPQISNGLSIRHPILVATPGSIPPPPILVVTPRSIPPSSNISGDPSFYCPLSSNISGDPSFYCPLSSNISGDPSFYCPLSSNISSDPSIHSPLLQY